MPDRRQEIELLRQSIDELAMRVERVAEAVLAELAKGLRAYRDEARYLREESRVQTRVLLQILDRLEPGGTAGTT
jgi:hypothetical protein